MVCNWLSDVVSYIRYIYLPLVPQICRHLMAVVSSRHKQIMVLFPEMMIKSAIIRSLVQIMLFLTRCWIYIRVVGITTIISHAIIDYLAQIMLFLMDLLG